MMALHLKSATQSLKYSVPRSTVSSTQCEHRGIIQILG